MPHHPALRLSALYAAMFCVIGAQTPFWPLWLQSRGMTAAQIGLLLGAMYWSKLVTNPLIAQFVDSFGHRRRVMIGLAATNCGLFSLYLWSSSFPALLALGVLSGSLLAGLMPLSETVTMTLAKRQALDYGRVRLWGSLSFILLANGTGYAIAQSSADAVVWIMLGGLAMTFVAVCGLPEEDAPRPQRDDRLPFRDLFRNRTYVFFLVTASLTQASHSVYYGFSSLYWQSLGHSTVVIGGLWALGVIAEIALFAFSGAVVRAVGAPRLLLLGAVGGCLRWTALGIVTDPWLIAPFQGLHAATFGATHLGAMHLISHTVDPRLSARAQALYSSFAMGLVPGIGLLAAGKIYGLWHGQAFWAGAIVAAGAVVAALKVNQLSATPKRDNA